MAKQPPIFITGAQRTGSSWVARMLTLGPTTIWIDEPFNLEAKRPRLNAATFDNYFTYIHAGNAATRQAAIADTLSLRYNPIPDLLAGLRRGAWRAILEQWNEWQAARGRDARPIVKQPTGLFMAEWLAETFDAVILILIRHPAAFVASSMQRGWAHDFADFTSQPVLLEDYLAPYAGQIEEFAGRPPGMLVGLSWLWRILYDVAGVLLARHPEWLFYRHEDLARDPVAGFRELYGRLEIPFTPAVATAIADYSGQHNPARAADRDWKSLHRHSPATTDQWRRLLTAEQASEIRSITAPVADRHYDDASWK